MSDFSVEKLFFSTKCNIVHGGGGGRRGGGFGFLVHLFSEGGGGVKMGWCHLRPFAAVRAKKGGGRRKRKKKGA